MAPSEAVSVSYAHEKKTGERGAPSRARGLERTAVLARARTGGVCVPNVHHRPQTPQEKSSRERIRDECCPVQQITSIASESGECSTGDICRLVKVI